MSLPLPWVDKIFQKLTLVYGRDFTGRWDGIEQDAVKADWAHELAGFQQMPDAISYGLQHLPTGKPPTVIEFRALCRKKTDESIALPLPKANPEMAAMVVAQLRRPVLQVTGNKDWARAIIARADAGEKVLPISLKFAKEALRPRSAIAA